MNTNDWERCNEVPKTSTQGLILDPYSYVSLEDSTDCTNLVVMILDDLIIVYSRPSSIPVLRLSLCCPQNGQNDGKADDLPGPSTWESAGVTICHAFRCLPEGIIPDSG